MFIYEIRWCPVSNLVLVERLGGDKAELVDVFYFPADAVRAYPNALDYTDEVSERTP